MYEEKARSYIKTNIIVSIGFALTFVMLVALLVKIGSTNSGLSAGRTEKATTYANNLVSNGLYYQAACEFENILREAKLDDKKKANLLFILGNLYMDNLKDYQNALATYIKLKTYYPDNPYTTEINQRVVTCLERIGRHVEAQAALQSATQIGSIESPQDKVIAIVGKRPITMSDLNEAISELPETLQVKYSTPQGKLEFLRGNLLTSELLYNLALRQGLNKDAVYLKRISKLEKNLLVQMAYEREVKDFPKVSETDLRLFFEARKDSLYKGKKFEEVRNEVAQDYIRTKRGEYESKLLEKLVAGETIEIYPESLGISAPAIKFGGGGE